MKTYQLFKIKYRIVKIVNQIYEMLYLKGMSFDIFVHTDVCLIIIYLIRLHFIAKKHYFLNKVKSQNNTFVWHFDELNILHTDGIAFVLKLNLREQCGFAVATKDFTKKTGFE